MNSIVLMAALAMATPASHNPEVRWLNSLAYSGYYGFYGVSPYFNNNASFGNYGGYAPYGGAWTYGGYGFAGGGCGYHGGCYGAYGNWYGGIVCSGCYGCHGGYSGYGMPVPVIDPVLVPKVVEPFLPKKVIKEQEELIIPK